MANTYIYGGEEYTIDPQAQNLPEGHADIMMCSECGGPGFFRRASENKAAHFVHHAMCRYYFPDCSKLSAIQFSENDQKIIYEGGQEAFQRYLKQRTKEELIEINTLLKLGPMANFYKRETELVEGYKEKCRELQRKDHHTSELVGRIRELTREVQHLQEVIQEEESNKKIKALEKLFNYKTILFKVEINQGGYCFKDELPMDKLINKIEEITCLLI